MSRTTAHMSTALKDLELRPSRCPETRMMPTRLVCLLGVAGVLCTPMSIYAQAGPQTQAFETRTLPPTIPIFPALEIASRVAMTSFVFSPQSICPRSFMPFWRSSSS